MRLFGSLIVTFLLLVASCAGAEEKGAEAGAKSVQNGIQELSRLQSLLEFFFMEAGVYPPTIKELNLAFNAELPRGASKVPIPKDPATGEDFIYQVEANRKGYTLRFPDATAYGLPADFTLKPVPWGWLSLRAERNRFEEMVKMSKYHIETLATQIEMYAKDNGSFPNTLDELYPKYIKRHPQDPITGRNYVYKHIADGYLVASPNPERYGLRIFQYSSSQGIQVEVLPEEKTE